jgi:hypothetical protein
MQGRSATRLLLSAARGRAPTCAARAVSSAWAWCSRTWATETLQQRCLPCWRRAGGAAGGAAAARAASAARQPKCEWLLYVWRRALGVGGAVRNAPRSCQRRRVLPSCEPALAKHAGSSIHALPERHPFRPLSCARRGSRRCSPGGSCCRSCGQMAPAAPSSSSRVKARCAERGVSAPRCEWPTRPLPPQRPPTHLNMSGGGLACRAGLPCSRTRRGHRVGVGSKPRRQHAREHE